MCVSAACLHVLTLVCVRVRVCVLVCVSVFAVTQSVNGPAFALDQEAR